YLNNTRYINNWDLVDSSAYHIVGVHLENRDRRILHDLARSESLWERRIAIISTLHFIKKQQYEDTLRISLQLLDDTHDLIHKAVGWMLREVGNRDLSVEQSFLREHYQRMPRTMLRYAIEKFPQKQRKAYLNGQV
ncbi:MAG: DNA alkylation repair protein, partial [Candidatus Thiodiazotropha sp.]